MMKDFEGVSGFVKLGAIFHLNYLNKHIDIIAKIALDIHSDACRFSAVDSFCMIFLKNNCDLERELSLCQ